MIDPETSPLDAPPPNAENPDAEPVDIGLPRSLETPVPPSADVVDGNNPILQAPESPGLTGSPTPALIEPVHRHEEERSKLLPILFGCGLVAVAVICFILLRPSGTEIKTDDAVTTTATAVPSGTQSTPTAPPLFVAPGTSLNSATPAAPGSVLPGGIKSSPTTAADPIATLFDKGVQAQRAGRNEEAISIYSEVLKQKPDAASAHLNLAVIYLQTQRPREALPHLQQAARLDPKNPAPAFQAAQVLIGLKRPQEALAPLQQAVRLAPDNPQGRGLLAELLMTLNRPQDAYVHWTELAKMKVDDGHAAFAAAAIAFEHLKRLPEAEKWARLAVEMKNPDPRSDLLLAQVLAARKKLSAAESALVAGARHFPNSIEIFTMLSEVRWNRVDKSGAIAALRSVAERIPAAADKGLPLARVRSTLGRLLAQTGNFKAAANELKYVVSVVPQDVATRAMLADVLLRSGDRAGAVAQLRRVTELDAKNLPSRLMLARVLADLGRLKDAQAEYSVYIKAAPNDINAISESAGVYEQRGLLPQAESVWSALASRLPDNPVPLLQRGRLLRKLNREPEAIQHYRHVLQIKPNEPNALIALAELEEKRGQYMRALGHLRALVSNEPDYAAAYPSLLRVAAKSQQLPATLNFLKLQLAQKPNRRVAYDAVLQQMKASGKAEDGRNWVINMSRLHPKAAAPQQALAAFNKANPPKPTTAPSPTVKTTPQSTPAAAPVPEKVPEKVPAVPEVAP